MPPEAPLKILGILAILALLHPGLAKDFRISVISDVHLELNYDPYVSSNSYCLKGGVPTTVPAFYGRKGCDPPHSLFASALAKMKAEEPTPDLILVPGDMVTHFLCYEEEHEFNETIYREIMGVMTNYTVTMAKAFPGVPIVFTEGNADYMYDYQVPVPKYKQRHYQELYNAWIKNIPGNLNADNKENSASMLETGSYTQGISKELIVVSFNSIYFSNRNRANNDPGTAEKVLEWTNSQLAKAKEKRQRVILMYHIPHGTYLTPVKEETFWVPKYRSEMEGMLRKYKDTISAIFTGHIHSSYLQSTGQARVEFPADSGEAEYYENLIVMRALAPIFSNNPGFAIFTYTNDNFAYLSHYDEYTFLLSRALNTKEDPLNFWQHLYNSKKDIGLENLSAAGISQFIQRLALDPKKLVKYMMYKIGEPFYEDSELAKETLGVCGGEGQSPQEALCISKVFPQLFYARRNQQSAAGLLT